MENDGYNSFINFQGGKDDVERIVDYSRSLATRMLEYALKTNDFNPALPKGVEPTSAPSFAHIEGTAEAIAQVKKYIETISVVIVDHGIRPDEPLAKARPGHDLPAEPPPSAGHLPGVPEATLGKPTVKR